MHFSTDEENQPLNNSEGEALDDVEGTESEDKAAMKARIDSVLEEAKLSRRRGKDQKTFHCGLCNKDYTTKQALYNHVWTHQPQKNFSCDLCDKKVSYIRGFFRALLSEWQDTISRYFELDHFQI